MQIEWRFCVLFTLFRTHYPRRLIPLQSKVDMWPNQLLQMLLRLLRHNHRYPRLFQMLLKTLLQHQSRKNLFLSQCRNLHRCESIKRARNFLPIWSLKVLHVTGREVVNETSKPSNLPKCHQERLSEMGALMLVNLLEVPCSVSHTIPHLEALNRFRVRLPQHYHVVRLYLL